jgi:chitin elicitor receptor kinase 1
MIIFFSYFRINIPFPCEFIGGNFLGHVFEYSASEGETYDLIEYSVLFD